MCHERMFAKNLVFDYSMYMINMFHVKHYKLYFLLGQFNSPRDAYNVPCMILGSPVMYSMPLWVCGAKFPLTLPVDYRNNTATSSLLYVLLASKIHINLFRGQKVASIYKPVIWLISCRWIYCPETYFLRFYDKIGYPKCFAHILSKKFKKCNNYVGSGTKFKYSVFFKPFISVNTIFCTYLCPLIIQNERKIAVLKKEKSEEFTHIQRSNVVCL